MLYIYLMDYLCFYYFIKAGEVIQCVFSLLGYGVVVHCFLVYLFLDEWFKGYTNCMPVFENLYDGVVPYGYPFFCEADDLKNVERLLFRKGFLCISWPDLPDAVRESSPSFYKKIRMVPFLW